MIIAALHLPSWFPAAAVGFMFTVVGLLKVYGLYGGVIGGRDQPWFQYAVGTCPAWVGRGWRGRALRYGLPFLFLGIGLWALAALVWEVYQKGHLR
jgi:hypothetical protein